MRIFYAASSTTSHDCLQQSRLWSDNLHRSLVDLGHDVVDSGYDFRPFNYNLDPSISEQAEFIRTHRPRASELLLNCVREAHRQKPIDLFFSYFYSAHVDPAATKAIRDMGIVTINYSVPRDIDVSFVGLRYGNRPFYMGELYGAGIDAHAWRPHWQDNATEDDSEPLTTRQKLSDIKRRLLGQPRILPLRPLPLSPSHCGPPLDDLDYIQMYSRSRISLGFTQVAVSPPGQPPIRQVRLWDFEATMSGAFYMVEAFDELTEFFEPDKEIVFSDSYKECIDKARYYLANAPARDRIRDAALHRARSEHTWRQRSQMVFRTIGLN